MTVRSRSSLRVSVRRDDDPSLAPPPTKRQRLHHHHSSSSSSRRKSSPDLLSDNTIENNGKSPHLSLRHANTPRSQPRRPPLSSQPPPDTPRNKGSLGHRNRTPASASTKLLLRDGRESPDPLDTISPCTVPKTRPRAKSSAVPAPATVSGTSAATRSTRHSLPHPPAAVDNDTEKDQTQNLAGSATQVAAEEPSSVANGISPSGQPTQPAPSAKPPAVTGRRSLRSHDGGSRSKSELASYFYNYEQILSLEPPKPEFLSGDTLVQLIDDLTEPLPLSRNSSHDDDECPFGNPLVNLNNCEEVELPEPDVSDDAEDPLNEETFFRAHRRVERQEKQIRNIERERAQHEKLQLERLLDELQGHDWLRVMGVSGVTDSEKKLYEPKRDHFIKEVSALINKFRVWKEEEKRRKLEKDRASSRVEATPLEPPAPKTETETESPVSEAPPTSETSEEPQVNGAALSETQSTAELPDPNDVDALAARQLHQEARSATARKRPKTYADGRRHTRPAGRVQEVKLPPSPPSPDQPFTSFYSKKHLRDAAMSKQRRGKRVVSAFGQPIPEMEEREFELPADILTEEAIHASRRQRRRMKRQSHG